MRPKSGRACDRKRRGSDCNAACDSPWERRAVCLYLMAPMKITRRDVLQAGMFGASVIGMGAFRASEAATPPGGSGHYADIYPTLDRFVEQYMRDMSSPGMTLVLADREAVHRVVTYGFGDLEARKPVQESELFQIGSISKSFVVFALLQLRDEGKLDVNRPVVDYLPWLRIESKFAPITVHHLLTHSSGLPGAGDVFQADPELGISPPTRLASIFTTTTRCTTRWGSLPGRWTAASCRNCCASGSCVRSG